jgi:hypothetical protein
MQYGERPASPENNLYEANAEARVRGEHPGSFVRPSLYSRATRHPAASLAVAGAAAAGASLFLWGRKAANLSRSTEEGGRGEELLEAHPT